MPIGIQRTRNYMVLTRRYITSHRTLKGGFTKAQAEVLGIKWPLKKGWIGSLVGINIPESKAEQFEMAKHVIK